MATSPTTTARPAKIRDADRSREAILNAAEQLFAARGYESTSLADIGVEAGVSRGTPSYFFGSKDELYLAVLERMNRDRNETLEPVFAPLIEWANAKRPPGTLSSVLTRCVDGYLRFLHERPSYVDIFMREALAGGDRLARLQTQSTVMEDAFAVLRRRARARGLKSFDPNEAIIALVSLAYLPVAHRTTMLRRQGARIDDARFRSKRKRHIVDVLLHIVGG